VFCYCIIVKPKFVRCQSNARRRAPAYSKALIHM